MAVQHGAPQSNGFLLNEATLMLGAVGKALDLTVEENSIGLFKNLQIQNTRSYTDLTFGVRQQIVDSALTEDRTTITGEGYEFTPRQIMFAMGQEGYNYTSSAPVVVELTAAAAVADTTVTVATVAGLAADDWVVVSPAAGVDNGLCYQIVSIAGMVITLDRPLVEAVPAGSKLYKSVIIGSNGSVADTCSGNTYLSAKIVSQKQDCKPIIMIAQKVRISSGFGLSFGTSDFANISYELTLLGLTPEDNGYSDWLAAGGNEFEVITQ